MSCSRPKPRGGGVEGAARNLRRAKVREREDQTKEPTAAKTINDANKREGGRVVLATTKNANTPIRDGRFVSTSVSSVRGPWVIERGQVNQRSSAVEDSE